ncbi:MAG TPA: NAD(P)-dependent alcohol dehydrogenase [Nocardioidaceae bacterium]|nr:NAD(P)-dependent alcohol dehydrogenase [Nocardioidaceae bacterium]
MRVSVLRGVGDVAVEERPAPQPRPHEVVVRVASVGVCGSDVHYYEHGRIGDHVVDAPLVLGHEASGTVVEAGSAVTRLRPGDRVSVEPQVPDLSCPQCLAGRYNLCERMRFFATPPVDGAFAEQVVVPELFAHPVPDTLGEDAAALIEPLSVGLWACRKGEVGPGSRVLVTGAGPVGLLAAQSARALGAASVTVTDVNPHRLALAEELGVDRALDVSGTPLAAQLTGRTGAPGRPDAPDVLLECSGSSGVLADALPLVAPAGRVVLVGMGADTVPLPVPLIQERELVVTGTFRYAHTWPAAIALAASGRVELNRLVTGHFGLADVEQALRAARTDPRTVKPVVRPSDRGEESR